MNFTDPAFSLGGHPAMQEAAEEWAARLRSLSIAQENVKLAQRSLERAEASERAAWDALEKARDAVRVPGGFVEAEYVAYPFAADGSEDTVE